MSSILVCYCHGCVKSYVKAANSSLYTSKEKIKELSSFRIKILILCLFVSVVASESTPWVPPTTTVNVDFAISKQRFATRVPSSTSIASSTPFKVSSPIVITRQSERLKMSMLSLADVRTTFKVKVQYLVYRQ